MAQVYEGDAVMEVFLLQQAELEALKNTHSVAILALQTEQVSQGIVDADHETRITNLEP